ncbi:hypothetical protein [Nocardioides pakistanensis]
MSAAAAEKPDLSPMAAQMPLVDLSHPVIVEAIRAAAEGAWDRGFEHGTSPHHTVYANPYQVGGPRIVLPFVP